MCDTVCYSDVVVRLHVQIYSVMAKGPRSKFVLSIALSDNQPVIWRS